MAACKGGHSSIVALLLQAGADPSQRNPNNGKTALHYCCELTGDELTASLLIESMPGLASLKVSALLRFILLLLLIS